MKTATILTKEGAAILVDAEDFDRLNLYSWSIIKGGYAARNTSMAAFGRRHIRIYLHKEVMRLHPVSNAKQRVDHKNGNTFDCRSSNLRLATQSQNCMNKEVGSTKRFGKFKGVFPSYGTRWRARVGRIHLGTFATEEEAAKAYDVAALKHYKEFAKTNFPKEIYVNEVGI